MEMAIKDGFEPGLLGWMDSMISVFNQVKDGRQNLR
jgi:hypothetical protein